MFWFWWLMTPFVGRNLADVTVELERKTTDKVIERRAQLAHQNELAACAMVRERAIELALAGMFGSTIPDQVRIFELEQRVGALEQIIESQSKALERASRLAHQEVS